MSSPYLELPQRTEAEARAARLSYESEVIDTFASMFAEALSKPKPANEDEK